MAGSRLKIWGDGLPWPLEWWLYRVGRYARPFFQQPGA